MPWLICVLPSFNRSNIKSAVLYYNSLHLNCVSSCSPSCLPSVCARKNKNNNNVASGPRKGGVYLIGSNINNLQSGSKTAPLRLSWSLTINLNRSFSVSVLGPYHWETECMHSFLTSIHIHTPGPITVLHIQRQVMVRGSGKLRVNGWPESHSSPALLPLPAED